MEELIIVGSGPAGWTAGIYAGRAQLAPFLITGSAPGGSVLVPSTRAERIESNSRTRAMLASAC